MTGDTLRQALEYASLGWPVFPCRPGQKVPATRHGHLDASTDPRQVRAWFARHPDRNLAIATGDPGPDVLDVDQRGPAGNGFRHFNRLRAAGLLDGATAYIRTPGGGLHAYFTGTRQRNGHLPAHYIDFLAAGGYVLAPPSQVGGRPYELIEALGGHGHLDWQAVTGLLDPPRQPQRPGQRQPDPMGISRLAGWVAAQPEGNRNAGLYWAANRALDADPSADLGPLAAAARQAGLSEREISRTLSSARRSGQQRPGPAGRQAEGETR
jgi:hypothetical protein